MALLLPHLVQLALPDGEDGTFVYLDVRAQVTPMTFNSAMAVSGIETRMPHMVIVRPGDADQARQGGRMLFKGKRFSVVTNPMTYEGIGAADHASFVVDQAEEGLDA